ncbi:hypothetical protein [Streptomyces venezuelae]|uniref:hypothetical protein n=1 Tax=Streptomyces venezuelae TaxID=54571 RepID=UPI00123B4108|nr:hypothetical protein [Streptomyces venezuelae]
MQDKARDQAQQDEWADEVLAWMSSQEEMDRALRDALRRTPSQREETIARMADALRGAAQGLTIPGCAAAAGVPERILNEWMEIDASFATALRAAHALAEAHGLRPGATPSPAALQLMLNAIRKGAAWPAAATLVGISVRGFNRLRAEAPPVGALIAAAQRARSIQAGAARRRRPPKQASRRVGYRIVQLDDPLLSPDSRPDEAADGANGRSAHSD